MVESPDPEMSHSLGRFPGRLFSHTIGFAPHACARGEDDRTLRAIARAAASMTARFIICLSGDLGRTTHQSGSENNHASCLQTDAIQSMPAPGRSKHAALRPIEAQRQSLTLRRLAPV